MIGAFAMVIQLGHPKMNLDSFPAFAMVSEAFLHLFRDNEEALYLFWHQIPLRLRYREDLYHSFDEILAMVWLIQHEVQGATKVDIMTQLLSMHWEIRWDGSPLIIRSTFNAQEDLFTCYAHALNQYPEVQMPKQLFLSEWKTLLHQIIIAFQSGHIEIQDGLERRKWELLQRVERQIPQYGQLYMRSV